MYTQRGGLISIIVLILIFIAGFFSNSLISHINNIDATQPYSTNTNELKSPYDHIKEEEIDVMVDKVVLNIKNATWAKFTDTNSMDPVIDKGANSIELLPKLENEIHIGDIISYKAEFTEGYVIHRVVDIRKDEEGTYYITKGDNNKNIDPNKVRFEQIRGLVVAVVY